MPLDELVDEALNRTDYRRAVTGSAEGDVFDRLDNLAEALSSPPPDPLPGLTAALRGLHLRFPQ